jgi:hypothetical protein
MEITRAATERGRTACTMPARSPRVTADTSAPVRR